MIVVLVRLSFYSFACRRGCVRDGGEAFERKRNYESRVSCVLTSREINCLIVCRPALFVLSAFECCVVRAFTIFLTLNNAQVVKTDTKKYATAGILCSK